MSKSKDGLAEILLKKAQLQEGERQRELQGLKQAEETKRRQYDIEVKNAADELKKYIHVIEEAKGTLDSTSIDVEKFMEHSLYDQYRSDPQYVTSEAQIRRERLENKIAIAELKRARNLRETNDAVAFVKAWAAIEKLPSKEDWALYIKNWVREMKALLAKSFSEPLNEEEAKNQRFFLLVLATSKAANYDILENLLINEYYRTRDIILKGIL